MPPDSGKIIPPNVEDKSTSWCSWLLHENSWA
jgi:hypothetical protein